MITVAELGLPTHREASVWGSSYVARARVDHECDLCGWTIPAGDFHWTWKLAPGAWDGDYWFVGHVHAICYAVYRNSEWSTGGADDILPFYTDFRSELLANVIWTSNNMTVFR